MEFAEQLIALYLTRGGKTFIVPSYSIPGANSEEEWACPDFVALDFEKHEVVVVEVTTASDIHGLIGKVRNREKQWFEALHTKLQNDGIAVGWPLRFLGFVRRANLERARQQFAGEKDVTFAAIEDASFPWWYWENRKGGLPR